MSPIPWALRWWLPQAKARLHPPNGRALAALTLLLPLPTLAADHTPPTPATTVVLVVGAPGEPPYGSNFLHQVHQWRSVCQTANQSLHVIPEAEDPPPAPEWTDHQQLEALLARQPKETPHPLWLVLIGHGTFDGVEARFNLRGPDLTATQLARWLEPFRRPLVIVNTASASAPFLGALSGTNRTVVTATRSGDELNFTRFGHYLAEALTDPASDLDRDGQTSLLELFLRAAHGVADFYKAEGRLATEHALLDDNGDRRGTPADWFRGIRAAKKPEAGAALDGQRAHQIALLLSSAEQELTPEQRARREALELEVERLRDEKPRLPEDDYYRRLERLLVEIGRIGPGGPMPTPPPALPPRP